MGDNTTSTLSRAKDKRLIFGAAIVALAAIFSFITLSVTGKVQAVLGGPTCNVPADYPTIQAAEDVAGCSTIKVAPGSYSESVVIDRSLTLKGAKHGDNVYGRTFGAANESTITGLTTIQAPGVKVDGFSITNPGQGLGIIVKTAGNNATIKNNIVKNVGGPAYADNSVGIYLEYGPDDVKVTDNKISNIQSSTSGSAQGILVGDSTSANPSLGIRISDNDISDLTSGVKGAYGIQINNGAKTPAENPAAIGYTTVKIRDNKIKNLTGNWAHGIGLEGDTPNVIVTGNTISNLTDTNPVEVFGPFNNAIAVYFESNAYFFTGDVTRNSLAVGSNAYGIAVHPSLTTLFPTLEVDGACNWWGAKNGPGTVGTGSGSQVSTGVDFQPWLKSSHLNGRCGQKHHHDNDNHHWNHGYDHDD